MDTGGWILLLIVAVCIAILIVVIKKSRDLDESGPAETSVTSTSRVGENPVEIIPQAEVSPQTTIYEYRSAAPKCLCANCDGENEWLANFCYICGEEIKKGVS